MPTVRVVIILGDGHKWIIERAFGNAKEAMAVYDRIRFTPESCLRASVKGLPRLPWKPGQRLYVRRLRRWVRFERWEQYDACCRLIGRDVPPHDRQQVFRRDELTERPAR